MMETDTPYGDAATAPDAPMAWTAWTWAAPGKEQQEQMAEALLDHLGDDDEVALMFAYLAEPEHAFVGGEPEYTAGQIAAMFRRGKIEYTSWAEHGEQWLDEHFPGAWTHPILGERLDLEDLEAMGEAEARSDRRYWWYKTPSGRVYGLLKPDQEGM